MLNVIPAVDGEIGKIYEIREGYRLTDHSDDRLDQSKILRHHLTADGALAYVDTYYPASQGWSRYDFKKPPEAGSKPILRWQKTNGCRLDIVEIEQILIYD
jgi:hypothetical protein